MTREWAFITRPKNWEICLTHRVFGFDEEYRETVSRYMASGDRALVYVTSPIKGIAAVVHIDRVSLGETEHLGWTAVDGQRKLFPDRVYWTPIKIFGPPISVAPGGEFLHSLQFLPDKKRYNIYLQVALIRISAEDMELALNWHT
jgi:predicted RNA-binding protein